jgi:hypothetical protein
MHVPWPVLAPEVRARSGKWARHLRITGSSLAVPAPGWLLTTSAVCCPSKLITPFDSAGNQRVSAVPFLSLFLADGSITCDHERTRLIMARPRFLARSQDPAGPAAPPPLRVHAPHEGISWTGRVSVSPAGDGVPPEPGWFTMTLQLSTRTVVWLADRPRARELVDSVWDPLTDLERAGHHPGVIAALRFVLVHHQPPTPTGRCPHCRCTWRRLWRRRGWPCVVWRQVQHELLGPFTGSTHHQQRPQAT